MSSSSQLPNGDKTLKNVNKLIDAGYLRKGLKKLETALQQGLEFRKEDINWLDSKFKQEEIALINKFYKHFIRIFLKQEKWNLAINLIRKTLERDKNYQSYLLLGDICRKQNMWSEALESYHEAIQIESRNTGLNTRFRKIIKLGTFNSDEWKELENLHYNLLEKDPNNTYAYSNLGDILTRTGKVEEAIKCYRTVCYQKNLENNPDWVLRNWSNHRSKGPNFVIIGVRKCGTTSLGYYTKQHPRVLAASRKEIKFFSENEKFKLGTKWYLSHFPPIPDTSDSITGEASPAYFYHPNAARRLARKFPKVKLILILRNPVDRAISEFNFKVSREGGLRDFQPLIDNELTKLAGIENLQAGKERDSDTRILLGGLYVYYLEKWMDYFSKEQILILKTEDLANEPDRIMHDIFEYLELPYYHNSQYEKKNAGNYNPIDEGLRSRLEEFYYLHNKKLEEYMGMSFNWN